jgi:hypothetical protein
LSSSSLSVLSSSSSFYPSAFAAPGVALLFFFILSRPCFALIFQGDVCYAFIVGDLSLMLSLEEKLKPQEPLSPVAASCQTFPASSSAPRPPSLAGGLSKITFFCPASFDDGA